MKKNINKILNFLLICVLLFASLPAYSNSLDEYILFVGPDFGQGEIAMKAGVVSKDDDGNEVVKKGEIKVKNGEKIKIKAIEGEHTRFMHWKAKDCNYVNLNKNLGDEKSKETFFTVKNATNENIKIHAVFYLDLPIKVNTKPGDVEGFEASTSLDKAINGEKVELSANSTNKEWEFSHWEFNKQHWETSAQPIIGKGSINEDIDLNESNITFRMVTPELVIGSEKDLEGVNITACFKQDNDVTIASIDDINEEVERWDLFELPSEVSVKMTDGSQQEIKVDWSSKVVDTTKLGEYIFTGRPLGYKTDKTVKLILRVIERTKPLPISSIRNITHEVRVGEKYILPKTVKATMIDGSKQDVSVSWNAKTVDTSKEGEYTFTGKVDGYNGKVKLTIVVKIPKYELNVQAQNSRDSTAKAGIVKEGSNSLVGSVIAKKGDEIRLKAIDGDYTRFRKWYALNKYKNVDECIENTKSRETIFTVNDLLDSNERINIDASFNVELPIEIETEPRDVKGIQANASLDSAISGEKVKLSANSTNEKWEFSHWEFDTPIIGANTPNENVDLNKSNIVFTMVTPIYLTEQSKLDLGITAHFKEKSVLPEEELEIKSVELLKDDECIAHGDIVDKEIVITLPEEMSKDVIENIGFGGYKLKIIATEGATVGQENGYEGDWSKGDISNSIMAGQSKKFAVYKGNKIVNYTIKIVQSEILTPPEEELYEITFNTNGGNNINSIELKKGEKIVKPTNPIKNGYRFVGWFNDEKLIEEFNFNTTIDKDITLYAKWEEEIFKEEISKEGLKAVIELGEYIKLDDKTEYSVDKLKDVIAEGKKVFNNKNVTREEIEEAMRNINYAIKELKYKDSSQDSDSLSNKEVPKITYFELAGTKGYIDDYNGDIYINLPYCIDLSDIVPVMSLSKGATVFPSKYDSVDFRGSVYYVVRDKNGMKKTYCVHVSMPGEREYDRYWDDYWYDYYNYGYDKKKYNFYRNRSKTSWWELSQEEKERREKEKKKNDSKKPSKYIAEGKARILNIVGSIEGQSRNYRSALEINNKLNYIELKPKVVDFEKNYTNRIIIPKGVLSTLKEEEYEFLRYTTNPINIDIYPYMETASGLKLNLCSVPDNIQKEWKKIKGSGRIFEVQTDSTKAGLSFKIGLEKQLPTEKLRFVKYDYMKAKFVDISPEKWYVFNKKLYCDKVSSGIYGVIYND